MEIKILKGKVEINKEASSIYVLSLGTIKQNIPAKIAIKIEGVDNSTLLSTCGCTTTASTEKDIYEIEYSNTNIISSFSKILVLNYTINNIRFVANVKITGNIIK